MKQTLKKTLVGLLFLAGFVLVPNLIANAFIAKDFPDTTNPCNSNTPRECEEINRPSSGGGTGGGGTIPSNPTPPTEPPMIPSGSASGSVTVFVLPPSDSTWNNDVYAYDKDCTIKLGENSCLAGFSWKVYTNEGDTFAATTPTNFTISTNPTAGVEDYKIEYPSRSFFFYKNGTLLHSINIQAKCDSRTSAWSSTEKKCVASTTVTGVEGSLNMSSSSCVIAKDASTCTVTGATWTTKNATSPNLQDGNTKNILSSLANNSTPLKVWVAYPKAVFNLNDGAITLDTKTISSSCASGSAWSSVGNKCTDSISGDCFDKIQNQDETGIDVGGACDDDPRDKCPLTPGIQLTLPCPLIEGDCFDKIQNQDETGIDVGGACDDDPRDKCPNTPGIQLTLPCPLSEGTCFDKIKNQNETGTDVGGVCDDDPRDLCPNTPGVQLTLPCSDGYCPSPTTKTTTTECPVKDGLSATSGTVTMVQTKNPNTCTFGDPVYLSDTCVYPCLPGNFWDPIAKSCANPSRSLSAHDCEIEIGRNSCVSSVDWSINTNKNFDITTPDHVLVANQTNPVGQKPWTIEYPLRRFFLYEEGIIEPTIIRTANATCKTGGKWDSIEKKCIASNEGDEGEGDGDGYGSGWDTLNEVCGECNGLTKTCTATCLGDLIDCPGNNGSRTKTYLKLCSLNGGGSGELNPSIIINLKADPSRMLKGRTSTLSWETTGAKECEAVQETGFGYFDVGADKPTSGSVSGIKPDDTTKYKIRCWDTNRSYNEATTEIKVYNINIKEI